MPASAADSRVQAMERAVHAAAEVAPRDYSDDPDYYFWWDTADSSSNCGGNTACDIVYSAFLVSRDLPEYLLGVARMAGPTDPTMSNNPNGGVVAYIDSDGDATDWEYRLWSAYADFPLEDVLTSKVEQWDGDSWELMTVSGGFYRTDTSWWAVVPWQDLGITSATLAMLAVDAAKNTDWSPSVDGTPVIPIAELVDGTPGQPTDVKATAGSGQVSLSWTAPEAAGTSAITGYTATATPGGATCTSTTTSCTVTGLTGGTAYSFTVTASNTQGAGPASEAVSATPLGAVAAPVITKVSYALKGRAYTASVAWRKPAGATGAEVRWALNGGAWSLWKKVRGTSVAIPGLVKGKKTSFEVRGTNAQGAGAVAKRTLAP